RVEHAALVAGSEQHAEQLVRRERAGRAQVVLPLVLAAEQASHDLARAQQAVDAARRGAPTDLQDLVQPGTEPAVQRKDLGVERDRCTELRATLHRLVEMETALPAQRSRLVAGESARA